MKYLVLKRLTKALIYIGVTTSLIACASSNAPAPVTQKSGPLVIHDKKARLEAERRKNLPPGAEDSNALSQTRQGLPGAVSSPLKDLNIRKPVPPDTLEKLGYVYTVNRGLNCREIARQIEILDGALGELDTDILAAQEIARRNTSTSETTLDVIGGIASSIIPLRPVVRTVTGARKAKKHYDERFDNGRRRRAFLKGYGLAKKCKPPAAPLITYAPNWGKGKPAPAPTHNRSWKDSYVPPEGR